MRISAGMVRPDEGTIVLEATDEDDKLQLHTLAAKNVAVSVRYDGPDCVRSLELFVYNPLKYKIVPIVGSH